jgi:hypothetical protein
MSFCSFSQFDDTNKCKKVVTVENSWLVFQVIFKAIGEGNPGITSGDWDIQDISARVDRH